MGNLVQAAAASNGREDVEAAAAWIANFKQDFAWRQAMVLKMRHGGLLYSEEETALIAKGLALFDTFASGTGKVRSVKRAKTVTSAWTKHDKTSGLMVGHVEATIRSSPQEIVAYLMHYDSKINLSRLDPNFDVRYEVLEEKNLHHIVVFFEIKAAPFQNRTFIQSFVWRKVADAPLTYVWVNVSIDRHDKVPPVQEARFILTSATPNEAVDALLFKYPVLGVTAQQHVWLRPMLETIAQRRMASAPLGLKLRLVIGAAFSTADMISDLCSIFLLRNGQTMGAYGMIGLISASLAMQMLVAILQTKHHGGRAVAWEVILVLSLVKPGVDAVRVSSGTEHVAGAPLDPFTEMIIGKAIEIACEAAPGAALQAAVIMGGHWSTTAVASVGISCVSLGFTTAMMAFDFDTNPARRKHTPQFFGYIAHSTRLSLFVELFTLHSAHAMVRTLTFAMLARTSSRWLVAYMAADFGVYVLYKIARGDLIFWMPGLGVRLSFLMRFFEKVILDSTGLVHLRRPCHAGGFYYCFNAVMTHVACFVAAALYSTHSTGIHIDRASYSATSTNYTGANADVRLPADDTAAGYAGKIDGFTLFATAGTLSSVWIIAFASLLLTMKREYVGTFVSMQTGWAFSQSYFLDNVGDDSRRIRIFYGNHRQWRSIRDLVRQWVLGAYATWLLLSPAWFNDALRALIPDDFMPAPVVQ